MLNRYRGLIALAIAVTLVGCTRVETGEIGLRQNYNKTFDKTELQPGSFNQTMVGDVFLFRVQDVGVEVKNLPVQAQDNSTLKDFDATAIYSVNPAAAYELWTTKNRAFHTHNDHGETFLMNVYMENVLKNASYKAVRQFAALELNDHRTEVEASIKKHIAETLAEEHLETAIVVSQIQVRSMQPAATITDSANELVRARNALATKTIEVQTATKEAERINALNANPKAIEYMNAQSLSMIAQATLAGKVNTVVIPVDFKGLVSIAPAK